MRYTIIILILISLSLPVCSQDAGSISFKDFLIQINQTQQSVKALDENIETRLTNSHVQLERLIKTEINRLTLSVLLVIVAFMCFSNIISAIIQWRRNKYYRDYEIKRNEIIQEINKKSLREISILTEMLLAINVELSQTKHDLEEYRKQMIPIDSQKSHPLTMLFLSFLVISFFLMGVYIGLRGGM